MPWNQRLKYDSEISGHYEFWLLPLLPWWNKARQWVLFCPKDYINLNFNSSCGWDVLSLWPTKPLTHYYVLTLWTFIQDRLKCSYITREQGVNNSMVMDMLLPESQNINLYNRQRAICLSATESKLIKSHYVKFLFLFSAKQLWKRTIAWYISHMGVNPWCNETEGQN